MLIRLLRTHLRPYTRWLGAVVVPAAGRHDGLALPAEPQRRHHRQRRRHAATPSYILATGGWMLAVTVVQIVCSIAAVYFGARVGDELRP